MELVGGFAVMLIAFLAAAGVVMVVFLACRELVCWYTKTNERLELEKNRNEYLKDIASSLKILIEVEVAKKNERDALNEFRLTGDGES